MRYSSQIEATTAETKTKNRNTKMSVIEKNELRRLLSKHEELCIALRNRKLSKEEESLMIEIEEKLEAIA
jgi:hypothetical protein